jgi:sugar lactone lactonase YvrE
MSAMPAELIEVAVSHDYLWNGALCVPEGRLFASMPGWLGPTPGVVEVYPDGSFRPFPGGTWNEWAPGKDPTQSFVDVNSIIADGKGSLWVLDAAAPGFGAAIEGAVKVIQISIATGRVERVITFDGKTAHAGTRLAHMRFHGDHAFMAESREGSFFVIDLRDDSYRRILVGHPLMRCRPEDVGTVQGQRVELADGRPMYIHNDLLEFGADPDTLFFMCLFGSRIFQAHVDTLKDPTLCDEDIARRVSVAYEFGPWIGGMCRDRRGNIYLSDVENNGVSVLRPDGALEVVVRHPEIVWPIAPSVGPDGYLYVPASQLNRLPMLAGGVDLLRKPWKIFKVRV